jgi:flagellar biosynthesis protein FlhF
MKIKRFVGIDMRNAMRQVREALGPEAVILETAKLSEGVEIAAAVDFDPVAYRSRTAAVATHVDGTDDRADAVLSIEPADDGSPDASPAPAVHMADWQRMREEVKNIRCLLEAQVSRLVWDERARRSPEVASIMRNLSALGMAPDVVNRLVREISPESGRGNSWTTLLTKLVNTIPVCEQDLVCEGGRFAVVGPTGVGKTTTVAKLAARFALSRRAEDIALVTMDTYRIGARAQLETFGKILGAPVYEATDAVSLSDTLRGLERKNLVLIDTAGMGQRDMRLSRELACLADAEQPIESLLTLPANVQTDAMQEIVDAFLASAPVACILTKIDEASSLGGAFSVLIRSGLPLAYVANGQRVPADLHFARSRQAWLVKAAVELMRRGDLLVSEEYMAGTFGEEPVDECA